MTLLRPSELAFGPGHVKFRQSRVAGTIGMVVLGAIFVAIGPVLWLVGFPWYTCLPGILAAALALLILPGMVRALNLPSNWVLVIDQGWVWINLRSPFNYHLPESQTVLRLELSEIGNVSLYSEAYSTPGADGGSTRWAAQSLQLKLTHTGTFALAAALEQEQKQPPAPRKVLGVRVSTLANHYPVSVPEPGTIRIAWRGPTMENRVAPSAERAIQLLAAAGARVEEPSRNERPDWSKLDGPELDSLVRELALSGKHIEAAKLLRQKRDLTLTEATRQVQEISAPK